MVKLRTHIQPEIVRGMQKWWAADEVGFDVELNIDYSHDQPQAEIIVRPVKPLGRAGISHGMTEVKEGR